MIGGKGMRFRNKEDTKKERLYCRILEFMREGDVDR